MEENCSVSDLFSLGTCYELYSQKETRIPRGVSGARKVTQMRDGQTTVNKFPDYYYLPSPHFLISFPGDNKS